MKKHSFYLALGLLVTLASCTKKTQSPSSTGNNNNTNNGITINSTPQFSGTINGTSYTYVNGSTYSDNVSSNKNIGGSGATNNSATYSSSILDNATYTKGITINKGTVTFPLSSNMPDTTTFKTFFAVGTYPYSINYTNGIEVAWTDPNGNMYSTSLGAGTQTGSSFKIVSEQTTTILGYYNVKILANFSCTLYNSIGSSVQLTNGVFVGYFENN